MLAHQGDKEALILRWQYEAITDLYAKKLFSEYMLMVLTGAHKRLSAGRILNAEAFDPDWPATIIHDCRAGQLWLDREATP